MINIPRQKISSLFYFCWDKTNNVLKILLWDSKFQFLVVPNRALPVLPNSWINFFMLQLEFIKNLGSCGEKGGIQKLHVRQNRTSCSCSGNIHRPCFSSSFLIWSKICRWYSQSIKKESWTYGNKSILCARKHRSRKVLEVPVTKPVIIG